MPRRPGRRRRSPTRGGCRSPCRWRGSARGTRRCRCGSRSRRRRGRAADCTGVMLLVVVLSATCQLESSKPGAASGDSSAWRQCVSAGSADRRRDRDRRRSGCRSACSPSWHRPAVPGHPAGGGEHLDGRGSVPLSPVERQLAPAGSAGRRCAAGACRARAPDRRRCPGARTSRRSACRRSGAAAAADPGGVIVHADEPGVRVIEAQVAARGVPSRGRPSHRWPAPQARTRSAARSRRRCRDRRRARRCRGRRSSPSVMISEVEYCSWESPRLSVGHDDVRVAPVEGDRRAGLLGHDRIGRRRPAGAVGTSIASMETKLSVEPLLWRAVDDDLQRVAPVAETRSSGTARPDRRCPSSRPWPA